MPKANLCNSLTSLDWADRHIHVLAAEFASFAETDPYSITTEKQPDPGGKKPDWTLFYLTLDKPIPKMFAPSVNAIVQDQRNRLDYLAVALAEANGAVNPKHTYFPIVKTKEGLSDKQTLKKIGALHPADQQVILDLKPYPGGNDTLYAIHTLNIERKHRRLGVLAIAPQPAGLGGRMRLYGFCADKPTVMLSKDPHFIAAASFEGELKLNLSIEIAFEDIPGQKTTPPVIGTLREFSRACREVVALFA